MNSKIQLNFHVYPLVVGQVDKYIFSHYREEGGSILLEASLADTSYKKEDVLWSSEDPEVAVVDGGLVQAMTTGTTRITAKLPDGASDACWIQVIDNMGRATVRKAYLNTDRLVLRSEEGAMLHPVLLPKDHFENGRLDPTFTWTSSDETVAVVNHLGRIRAMAPGRAVITGRTNDVGREVSCHVTVVNKPEWEWYIDPLEDLDGGTVALRLQEHRQLSLPAEVLHQPVFWSSEDPETAGVDQTGLVTGYKDGEVMIWATFINGGWRTGYRVQVRKAPAHQVTEACVSPDRVCLAAGEQTWLHGVVFPATLLEKRLLWSSSDETVVRIIKQHINLSGLDEILIEGVSAGTADITGSCADCEEENRPIEVTCKVTVTETIPRLKTVRLPEEKTIQAEETASLLPVCNYEDGGAEGRKEVFHWISANRQRVTVDREGVVRGCQEGTATVCCVADSSLTDHDRERLEQIGQLRAPEQEEATKEELRAILSRSVYGVCTVHVRKDQPCLYHLHVPGETIRPDSVCLLWNRDSLADLENFSHYEIYDNGRKIGETGGMGYTVYGLAPESDHTFTVTAVAGNEPQKDVTGGAGGLRSGRKQPQELTASLGGKICRQTVEVRTKPAPLAVLDVTRAPYHAVGDGVASDTCAIQRAIDDCPAGGEVVLPKGYVFVSGALFLKSHMTFRVDGILFGSEDPAEYPPVVCRWEGYRKLRLTEEYQKTLTPVFEENVYSHSSLINVGVYDEGEPGTVSPCHTFDVCICGEGMINGNGFNVSYNQGPCWYTLRKGLPIPQSPKKDQNVRGRLIAFYNTKGVYMRDVTVGYGSSWTLHPVFCDGVTFDNVKVISMGDGRTGTTEGMLMLNGDGIDVDSSIHVNIVNSYFTVGDDAVAIKSGRNRQGAALAKPSAYVRVTDCRCVDAKGSFAIGSESSGGVHDILFQNLQIENITNFGLWIKSAPCRGGLVEDVVMRDCLVKKTGGALQIEYNHGGDEDPAPALPVTRRVLIENICFAGKHKFGIRLMGHPESPICDVTMRNLVFSDFVAKRDRKFVLEDCREIHLDHVKLPGGYVWEKNESGR